MIKKILSLFSPILVYIIANVGIENQYNWKIASILTLFSIMIPLYFLNTGENTKIIDGITTVLTYIFIAGMLSCPILLFI